MIATDAGRDPGIWNALATELGLLGAAFGEEHGGLGGGALENAIADGRIRQGHRDRALSADGGHRRRCAEGRRRCASCGAYSGIISGETIIAFAYAEPQGRYDLANIRTTAKADGSGYILNGHKGVVYCAPWATHLLVTARTGGSTRERNGVELFLIDANLPGITRRDYPTVDGNRASEIYFENVAIPGDALLAGGNRSDRQALSTRQPSQSAPKPPA
jgi:alkylation response protein AidB-like acyl-CoA dehydrogenase